MGIKWQDTLYAHHAYASHLRQALDQLVSEYTNSSPWKIEHGRRGRGQKKIAPELMAPEDLALYNAKDCRLTAKVWASPVFQADLATQIQVYEHDLCLAELCSDMTYAGIQIDHQRQKQISSLLEISARGHIDRLIELSGDPAIGPNKTENIRRVLYGKFGLKRTVFSERTGKPSTAKAVIEAIRVEDSDVGRFCNHLALARELLKSKSTYVDFPVKGHKKEPPIVFKVLGNSGNWDPHGVRAHYQWGPRERRNQATAGGGHTVSGRLASRLQSAPRYNRRNPADRVREIYVPRSKDHIFVYFDVKQGEPRVAAYLSGDPERIKATLGDVHAANAKIMFPEIAAKGWLDGDAMKDPAKGKPVRDLAKTSGLAIDYFAEPETAQAYINSHRIDGDGKALFGVISLRTVRLFIAKVRHRYRVYVAFVESNKKRVEELGYLDSPILGRRRWLGWHPSITDVANYPIQSCLADVMNLRSLYLQGHESFKTFMGKYPELCEKVGLPPRGACRPLDPRIQLVAQIHDSCIFDCPKSLASKLQDKINLLWNAGIDLPGGRLVLPVDLKTGARLSDL